MKLYDCTVQIECSPLHQVNKTDVTAAEILVLREIHGGPEAVINIKPVNDGKKRKRSAERTSAEERARLASLYASPSQLTDISVKKKLEMLTSLFGHESMPLPTELADTPVVEEKAEPAFAA